MAEQPLVLIGDVLVELVREGIVRLKPKARVLIEQVRQAAAPPRGVAFTSDDGAAYTGLVLLDANKVVMMLAARTEPLLVPRQERHERPPLITPPPAPQRPYYGSQRSLYEREPEEEEPDWGESGGYGRYK